MKTKTDSIEVTPNIIAAGGISNTILLRNGSSEVIKVRLLEMEHYLDFITLQQSEHALAEFLCEKPAGWAKTVSNGSILDIVEQGRALNFTDARRFLEGRAAIAADLAPLSQAAQSLLPAKASATSAPASA